MHYTKRDHDTLSALVAHADEERDVVMANKKLASILGITPGAAVPRLDRLRALDLISIDYDINPYNGNVRRRTIHVKQVPPAPFAPTPDEAPLTEAELQEMDRLAAEAKPEHFEHELEPDPDAPLVEDVKTEWGINKIVDQTQDW